MEALNQPLTNLASLKPASCRGPIERILTEERGAGEREDKERERGGEKGRKGENISSPGIKT